MKRGAEKGGQGRTGTAGKRRDTKGTKRELSGHPDYVKHGETGMEDGCWGVERVQWGPFLGISRAANRYS